MSSFYFCFLVNSFWSLLINRNMVWSAYNSIDRLPIGFWGLMNNWWLNLFWLFDISWCGMPQKSQLFSNTIDPWVWVCVSFSLSLFLKLLESFGFIFLWGQINNGNLGYFLSWYFSFTQLECLESINCQWIAFSLNAQGDFFLQSLNGISL